MNLIEVRFYDAENIVEKDIDGISIKSIAKKFAGSGFKGAFRNEFREAARLLKYFWI